MTTLGVWAKGLPRLLCALIGILVGSSISCLLDVFPKGFGSQISESPIFAVPDPRFLSYGFQPSLMVPLPLRA
jgi:xanthine permease XanP